jgi:hypothetical protein
MQIDMLSSIELTACSAIAIYVMATGFGDTGIARIRIAGGLSLWFVFVTLMATWGILTYPHGLGAPGLGISVVLPIIILSVLVIRTPSLLRTLQTIPLGYLIGVHAIRILGVSFLILYSLGRLPAPFAPMAGWGDILAGLIAIPLAWQLLHGRTVMRPAIWFWNIFGLLDLVAAISLGAISAPGPIQLIFAQPGTNIMTTLPWLLIPAFLVPLLASIHLAIFYRLMRPMQVALTHS